MVFAIGKPQWGSNLNVCGSNLNGFQTSMSVVQTSTSVVQTSMNQSKNQVTRLVNKSWNVGRCAPTSGHVTGPGLVYRRRSLGRRSGISGHMPSTPPPPLGPPPSPGSDRHCWAGWPATWTHTHTHALLQNPTILHTLNTWPMGWCGSGLSLAFSSLTLLKTPLFCTWILYVVCPAT